MNIHCDPAATHPSQAPFRSGRADPGRLDWFTSAMLPGGSRRVRICRCARSTPSEAVELDPGTSALQRNPADLRGLAVLGELARADPAVCWPATRQAVLRAFHARPAPNPGQPKQEERGDV